MTNKLLNKYKELIDSETLGEFRPEQNTTLLLKLGDFLEKNHDNIHSKSDAISIGGVSDSILRMYKRDDKEGYWERRAVYIRALYFMSIVQGNTYADQLKDKCREFIGNTTAESLASLDKQIFKTLVELYPNEFRILGTRDLKILKLGLSFLSSGEIPSLVTNLLDKQKTVDQNQKEQYFDFAYSLKITDQSIKDRFHADLLEVKPYLPGLAEKYSRKKLFFSRDQNRQLRSN